MGPSTSTPTATPDSSAAQGGYPADSSADMLPSTSAGYPPSTSTPTATPAFVLDMRRQRSGSSGQPPTVDQMVALYFDKLESGVGELDRLLQIAETPANPPTDRPAPAAQESSLLMSNY